MVMDYNESMVALPYFTHLYPRTWRMGARILPNATRILSGARTCTKVG